MQKVPSFRCLKYVNGRFGRPGAGPLRYELWLSRFRVLDGCFKKLGVLLVGGLLIKDLVFRVYILKRRSPNGWK